MVFLELRRYLGYILELQQGGHSKLHFVQQSQDSRLVTLETSEI